MNAGASPHPSQKDSPRARLTRYAWLPLPTLFLVISGLWVADLRGSYESRAAMVLLNLVFTWLAALSICVLAARGFLACARPGLLMFGCGSLVWGTTSLAAATVVDRLNVTVTIHNVGVLAAALCHFAGLLWGGNVARPSRWLAAAYTAAASLSAAISWASAAGATPLFFVQGEGGTPIRHLVLFSAVGLFAAVAWRMLARHRRRPRPFYYWYGLGLALVATALTGVALLTVQGSALGWACRLTQYLGSAYLLVAAYIAARETRLPGFSLTASPAGWVARLGPALLRQAGRYLLSAGAAAAALGLWLVLHDLFGMRLPPFITFYPAVMCVGLLAGFGPGIATTLGTAALSIFWMMTPPGAEVSLLPADRLALFLFVAMGVLMSAVAELYRRSRDRADAYGRALAVRELGREKELLTELLRQADQPFAVGYPDGRLGMVNRAYETLTGYTAEELRSLSWRTALAPPEWRSLEAERLAELARTGEPVRYEMEYLRKDGSRVPLELLVHLVRDAQGSPDYYYWFFTDITGRKRTEYERDLTVKLLGLISAADGLRVLAKGVVTLFRELSDCQAVGLRLREGDDFPYYETRGFPQSFVRLESPLCKRDEKGQPLRDSAGNPLLECMCGNILCGRFDPSLPFFTAQGSFWTNSTSVLLATTTDAERQVRTRNRCNREGYESVALIPLRVGNETLGLLQLNDRRPGRFSQELIALAERLAAPLAMGLAKLRAEEALHESQELYRLLTENSADFVILREIGGSLIYRSPSCERVLGWTEADEQQGRDWRERVHPDDVQTVAHARATSERGEATHFTFRQLKKDGSWLWLENNHRPVFGPDGRPTHVVVASRDITDRKRAEEALNQKLLELSRFNRLAVGRELRMIELKKEINALHAQAGRPPPYSED